MGMFPNEGKDVSFQPLHLETAGAFCLGDRALFIPLLSDNAEGKVGLLVLLLLFRTILLVGVNALHQQPLTASRFSRASLRETVG